MKSLANIMIIGEDKELLKQEELYLLKEGFNVVEAHTIIEVEEQLEEIQLIIFDCEHSKINGIDYIQYLREKGIDTPIIVLSKDATEEDIERTFLYGADDHIAKPLNLKELIFRSKALLKRTYGLKQERLSYKNILMDMNARITYIDEVEVELTKLEFNLLAFFIQNKNMILERKYILESIWNDASIQKRTVNVSINRLLKKIDPYNRHKYFTAIRGLGYRFN